jgi:hypothetical protein
MTDIVERLRDYGSNPMLRQPYAMAMHDAAAEIERLREGERAADAEIERLRGLLREGLRPWPLAVSDEDGSNMRSWRDDWERRVREALGGQ